MKPLLTVNSYEQDTDHLKLRQKQETILHIHRIPRVPPSTNSNLATPLGENAQFFAPLQF